MTRGGGVEKPHGAENSALKNTAPFSLTPLRISENASTMSSGLSAKFAGLRAKEFARVGLPSKRSRRSDMDVSERRIAQLQAVRSINQGEHHDKPIGKHRESQ